MLLPDRQLTSDLAEQLAAAVAAGFVSAKPYGPLTLYNYTPKAQYERAWNPAIRMARGLIVEDNMVVARPFPKFHNADEEDSGVRPGDPFEATEKLDGSLGIMHGDRTSTRGSVESEQAEWATEWLRAKYPGLTAPDGITPLFEIIYPDNRIVVDYGDRAELVLLAGVDIETGRDVDLTGWWPGASRRTLDIAELDGLPNDGTWEGYVIRYLADDHRIKVKLDEYVRLHRLVTGTTARTIWESLSVGGGIGELLDRVPDEFYQWANQTAARLETEHAAIVRQAERDFDHLAPLASQSRKDFALEAKDRENAGLLFALLDGKPIDQAVWRMIYPAHETPFRTDI